MLVLVGCSTARIEGPQIVDRPPGFALSLDAESAANMFPDREVLAQRGYFTKGRRASSIMITEYEGAAERSEAQAARDRREKSWSHAEVGSVESLKIDGRSAWGWTIDQKLDGELKSKAFVAVVPYGESTYAIEFYASNPQLWKGDLLRDTVRSFAVVHKGSVGPFQILALVGLGVGVVFFVKRMRRLEAEG